MNRDELGALLLVNSTVARIELTMIDLKMTFEHF